MAQDKIIETIIKEFMENDFPEEVQIEFQEWMMNSENRKEKDEALIKIASSLNPEFDHKEYSNKLNKLNDQIDSNNKKGIRKVLVRYSYIAAACLLIAMMTITVTNYWNTKATKVFVTSQTNKGEFTLPDGSTVVLNSSSKLEVPSNFSSKRRNVKLNGEAYFDIVKDPSHPFHVYSKIATIKVFGTAFNLKAYSTENYAEVVLVRGSVEASGGSLLEPVMMHPGEKLTISKSAHLEKVRTNNYTSWTGKQLVIDNLPLKDVLINLEHWYNVEFIPSPGKVDLSAHLSFVVRDEDIESILKQISLLTSFNFKIADDKVYYNTDTNQ